MADHFRSARLDHPVIAAVRPVIESLETRTLLSAQLLDGTLAVNGTSGDDWITVRLTKDREQLRVAVNGEVNFFQTGDVESIRVLGLAGNDDISFWEGNGSIDTATWIHGGSGDDIILGAAGEDVIRGGRGSDDLHGADAADVLVGGEGSDELNAGAGEGNVLRGNEGDDTLGSGNRTDRLLGGDGRDEKPGVFRSMFPVTTFTGNPDSSGYSPDQMRMAYKLGDYRNEALNLTGRGQGIAIVVAFHSPRALQDLRSFSAEFDLPMPNKKTFQTIFANKRKPRGFNEGWNGEAMLDIQWAHAVAPQAKIYLVEAQSDSFGDIAQAIQRSVTLLNNNHGGGVVSMSLGSLGGDAPTFANERFRAFERIFSSKRASRISFIGASGDTGAEVTYPATSPHVTAVGGTNLALDGVGNRIPNDLFFPAPGWPVEGGEVPWPSAGGGPSAIFDMPVYQRNRGIPGTFRGTPDVAWAADPSVISISSPNPEGGVGSIMGNGGGVPVYNSFGDDGRSGWFAVGGTSAGTPQFAAMIAMANQLRKMERRDPIGQNLNNFIYRLAGTGPDQYFNDIGDISEGPAVSGLAGDPVTGFVHEATEGWDFASGWGSPNAHSLIPALAGVRTPIIRDDVLIVGRVAENRAPTATTPGGFFNSAFRGQARAEGRNTINLFGITQFHNDIIGSILLEQTFNTDTSAIRQVEIVGVDPNTGLSVEATIDPDTGRVVQPGTPLTLFRMGNTVMGAATGIIRDTSTTGGGGGGGGGGIVERTRGPLKFRGTIKGNTIRGEFIEIDIGNQPFSGGIVRNPGRVIVEFEID